MKREDAAQRNAATAGAGDRVPVVRPGVRVLVIDDVDRVLLFASIDDAGQRFWYPPGGGSEPGERGRDRTLGAPRGDGVDRRRACG